MKFLYYHRHDQEAYKIVDLRVCSQFLSLTALRLTHVTRALPPVCSPTPLPVDVFPLVRQVQPNSRAWDERRVPALGMCEVTRAALSSLQRNKPVPRSAAALPALPVRVVAVKSVCLIRCFSQLTHSSALAGYISTYIYCL